MPLPNQFKNRNCAIILGAGISGLAAASLLCKKGFNVSVFGSCSNEARKNELSLKGVEFCTEEIENGIQAICANPQIAANSFAVLSPGISIKSHVVSLLTATNIPIIGEMELGLLIGETLLPYIAITGSKGKSSIVKLIADTLSSAGKAALPCGNYGTATCTVAEKEEAIIPVVECSSFQLESITEAFAPAAALLLNVSPDHLDRHSTIEEYRDIKLGMFKHCKGLKLIPEQTEYSIKEAVRALGMEPNLFTYFGSSMNCDFSYSAGKIHTRSSSIVLDISGSYFDNHIIGPGAAAAAAILFNLGLTAEQIECGFKSFTPLAHRMQKIREIDGVTFINDSKATSIAALFAGCKMASTAKRQIFLIAGGRLKEKITLNANDLVDFCVKKVYIIGECLEEMASAWESNIDIERCYTIEVAVKQAFIAAKEAKGIVLLSPGTASFDQFKSYNERGECFTKLVEAL